MVKIGLEVHSYLKTNEKLFCTCKTNYQRVKPNLNICETCTGMPGNKPMLPNKAAVEKCIAIGLMLGCKINKEFLFQRKHYDWSDLPNGYQKTISGAYSVPVGEKGKFLGINIREVHLEEDPAKWDPRTGYVDYNRSGMPLIEIVTEPEFKEPEEVRKWLRNLVITMGYIKAIDKDAGVKCDVNISSGGERVEIKNLNSLWSIVRAIEYEIERQKTGEVVRETRAFVEKEKVTVSMRSKEAVADYRFIPDPDLVIIDAKDVEKIKKSIPELPHKKVEKYIKYLKVEEKDAKVLTADILLAELFEKVAKKIDPKLAVRWLVREIPRVLHYNKKNLEDLEIDESHIIELLDLLHKKKITETTAQKILEKLIEKPFSVKDYVAKEGLVAEFSSEKLERICKEVIKENNKAVEDYKQGREESLHFLMGQVMRKTKGTADPEVVKKVLKKLL